jgi:hypothetical protein
VLAMAQFRMFLESDSPRFCRTDLLMGNFCDNLL